MDFLDAVLIAKTRGLEEEVRTHNLAPDLVLATKTLINGMDAEMKKASECGYVKGFADAEKEKYALAEKVSDELDKLDKVKSLLHAHTDFSRETPEVNYELVGIVLLDVVYGFLESYPAFHAHALIKCQIGLVGDAEVGSSVDDGFVESEYRVFLFQKMFGYFLDVGVKTYAKE